ncbi:MAG: DNA-processing protein DprA [Ruminococcus sp.]|nr:DNA-processing protein DprA [Ruminococcus sp.]
MDICAYWFWLVCVFGPANRKLWKLAAGFDTVERFVDAVKSGKIRELSKSEAETAAELDIMEAAEIVDEYRSNGIKVYCYESEGYPDKLREIHNPPAVIFVRGSLDFLDNSTVIDFAGAREPSAYSSGVTELLCAKLAERGCVIASGMANGIDMTALNAAVKKGFPTLGVCGLAIDLYEDDEFAEEIVKNGALISENCERFERSRPNFVERNRLIVGLSDAIVFVEGSVNSKGLNLCEQAISGGRFLFVIPPHDITDDRYSGQAWLIRRGCRPVFSEQDILFFIAHTNIEGLEYTGVGDSFSQLSDYSFFKNESPEPSEPKTPARANAEKALEEAPEPEIPKELDYSSLDEKGVRICELLKEGTQLADMIAAKLDMNITDVLTELTRLEVEGFVRSLPGKQYSLI